MNILSWNIMSGGFNSYNSTEEIPDRLDLLVSTIKLINADFVSLVDTHRWTEVFSNEDLIRLFGYGYVYSVKLNDDRLISIGHDNGVTVLSRLPVEKFEMIRISGRNAIKTSIDGFDIFTTYLDDVSEDTRLKQVDMLLKMVKPNIPTVIVGDLNTFENSEVKTSQSALAKLFAQNPKFIGMKPVMDDMARAEVIRLLELNEFVDTGKNKGNTIPSKLFPIKLDEPILRVDYGLCTPNIKINNFEVLRGEEYDQLSDHYPIKLSISLK